MESNSEVSFLFQEASTTPSRQTTLSISDGSSAETERIPKTSGSMLSIDETPTIQRIGSTRRTPKFTTRRSNSLKKVKTREDFGPIDMHGHLDRKQDLQVSSFAFLIIIFARDSSLELTVSFVIHLFPSTSQQILCPECFYTIFQ